jgi:hypothetical protein
VANGITIVAGISISTKIAGSDTGVSVGPGIVGNNPDLNVGGQSLLTSSGVALQTDAGVQINTSN